MKSVFLHSFEVALLQATNRLSIYFKVLPEPVRFGDDCPEISAADFPSLCSARRNMALIHPAVVSLFLLSPAGWYKPGSGDLQGTERGFPGETKTVSLLLLFMGHFNLVFPHLQEGIL